MPTPSSRLTRGSARSWTSCAALGLDKNTYVFWTTDNGAWQDVYPDAGYTPFRGTKGTVREGGNRVPAIAWGRAGSRPARGTTTSSAAWTSWPPSPPSPASSCRRRIAKGSRSSSTATTCRRSCSAPASRPATTWFYFTENELSPGAVRFGNYKFVFNLRGDDGAPTGGLAVDTNLGWKGAEKYVATVPQVFDLWQDPQERYDIFMNNFTERTWMGPVMEQELKKIMKTSSSIRRASCRATATPARSRSPATSGFSGFAISLRKKA